MDPVLFCISKNQERMESGTGNGRGLIVSLTIPCAFAF